MRKILPAYAAWIIALVATLSSLYYSEVRHFLPCALCWYQRILLYPLVLVLPVGILKKDQWLHFYVLPLAIIGGLIALYQNLLVYKVIPESAAPCVAGVSCTVKYVEYFGFITIPFLSLTAFVVITICMMIYGRQQTHAERS